MRFAIAIGLFVVACAALIIRQPDPPDQGADEEFLSALVNQLSTVQAAASTHCSSDPTATHASQLRFPKDYKPHADAANEFFSLYAVLQSESADVYSVVIQFVRANFRDCITPRPVSNWAFDDVIAARTLLVDVKQRTTYRKRRVSRMALGLAETTASGIEVADLELDIKAIDACTISIHTNSISAPPRFSLKIHADHCPHTDSPAFASLGIASYALPPMRVEGEIDIEQGAVSVIGTAWGQRAWGLLPTSNSALVWDRFDILDTRSEPSRLVSILRSRRRDGSGTPILSAQLLLSDGSVSSIAHEDIQIEYIDNDRWYSRDSAVWSISIPHIMFNARLKPLRTVVRDSPSIDDKTPGQDSWTGIVEVTYLDDDINNYGYAELATE